jgi:hypothetical protein
VRFCGTLWVTRISRDPQCLRQELAGKSDCSGAPGCQNSEFLVPGRILSKPASRGLLSGKLAAGGLQDFPNGVRLNELKTVAKKGASLANRGTNRHRTGRKRNVQLHHLADGDILSQNSADSDLADVDHASL